MRRRAPGSFFVQRPFSLPVRRWRIDFQMLYARTEDLARPILRHRLERTLEGRSGGVPVARPIGGETLGEAVGHCLDRWRDLALAAQHLEDELGLLPALYDQPVDLAENNRVACHCRRAGIDQEMGAIGLVGTLDTRSEIDRIAHDGIAH